MSGNARESAGLEGRVEALEAQIERVRPILDAIFQIGTIDLPRVFQRPEFTPGELWEILWCVEARLKAALASAGAEAGAGPDESDDRILALLRRRGVPGQMAEPDALYWRVTGQRSRDSMTPAQTEAVIEELRRLGLGHPDTSPGDPP